jgi:hypothetical protein
MRHPHGDALLYIVWLKLGTPVAQKSEYLKARFGVQRGPTNNKRPCNNRVMKKACEDNSDPQFLGTFR